MQKPDIPSANASSPDSRTYGQLNPWMTIWTRPRTTVRWMVERNPADWLWLLLIMGGTSRVMARLSELPVRKALDVNLVMALVLVGGPLAGLLLVFAYGRLLHTILRRLGGVATWVASRTAIAWSLAPGAPSLALWGIMVASYGVDALSPAALEKATGAQEKLVLGLDYFVQFGLAAWSLILEIVTLADVHRVRLWKVLLSEFALGVAVLAVAMLVMSLA